MLNTFNVLLLAINLFNDKFHILFQFFELIFLVDLRLAEEPSPESLNITI